MQVSLHQRPCGCCSLIFLCEFMFLISADLSLVLHAIQKLQLFLLALPLVRALA